MAAIAAIDPQQLVLGDKVREANRIVLIHSVKLARGRLFVSDALGYPTNIFGEEFGHTSDREAVHQPSAADV